MLRVGAMAALQGAAPEGGASLTLGTWGVLGLAAILAGAAAGWVLFALSRRRSAAPPPPPAPGPSPTPPHPPLPAPEDPLDTAFRAAESGLADVVLLCRAGRIVRAGAGTRAMLGLAPEDIVGQPPLRLCAAEDVIVLAEALRRVQEGGETVVDIRFRLPAVPGAVRKEASARLVRPGGVPAGDCVIVLMDVSGPAAIARGAAAMASRIDEALGHLGDGVIVTEIDGAREYVEVANQALERLLGVPAAALPGRGLAEVRERLAARLPEGAPAALLPEHPAAGSAIIEISGEPPRLIERSCRPIGARLGARGRLFIFRDVTRERVREEDLRRAAQEAHGAREKLEVWHEQLALANEGLERRMAGLARFNRELKSLDEMKSNLLANVSHELQTPLVSIKGYTEMILKGRLGPLTEEQERGLRVALRNIDRLISLIDGLLTFARAERDAARLRLTVFPLRPLVEEVVELLKDRAGEKRLSVAVKFPAGDLAVRGDRDRIAQVFINLLSNAIKYNAEGGSVSVEASRGRKAQARVEVRDTGPGIPREDLDRIFDRYYRGGAEGGEGSGLGLAITKDILRLHGCMIRADSEPGRGSVFSFTLPLEPRGRGDRTPHAAGSEES